QRRDLVRRGEHYVARALVPGDGLVPIRGRDAAVLQRDRVVDLQRETGRGGAGDEPADLAGLLDVGRRLLPRHPGGVEATLDVLELRLVGALPPHAEQGVLRAGDDDPPVRVLVHTEVERIRVVAVALDKAEDLVAVPAPRVHVRRLDADV